MGFDSKCDFSPSTILFGEGNGTPLQYSCLENPMDGGAWWAAVHGVTGSRTELSDFTLTFHFHALEKEMATHSSVRAWRIPGTVEPGGLLSMGLHRVGHDRSNLAAAAAAAVYTFLHLSCLFYLATWPGDTPSNEYIFSFLSATAMHMHHIYSTSPILMDTGIVSNFCYYNQCCKEYPCAHIFLYFCQCIFGRELQKCDSWVKSKFTSYCHHRHCPTSTLSPPVIRENVFRGQ